MRKVYLGVPTNNALYCEILESTLWQLHEGIWKKDPKKKKFWYGISLDKSGKECCYVFSDKSNSKIRHYPDRKIIKLYLEAIRLIKDKYAHDYSLDESVSRGAFLSVCCDIPCKYLANNAAASYGDVNTVMDMMIGKMMNRF